jgi:uncharacterized protein (DUF58 family)
LKRSWGIFFLWLAALLFALNTGRDLAFDLLYFVTGVILLALWWAWANLRGLQLRRVTRPQRSQVGRYLEESLELTNNSRWPKLWVEVLDQSDLPGHQISRVVNSLGQRATSRWQARTLCRLRGRFTLGPLALTSGDPLGLFRFTRKAPGTLALVVVPATVAIPQFSPPSGYLAGGELIHRRTPYITTSVSTVRDYVPGDSFNRIHWKSTARTGRLISKEFELDPLADVWIFLDMHEGAQAESPWTVQPWEPMGWMRPHEARLDLPPSTTEYGVTIAASLAQHFIRLDRAVGFLSYAGQREVVQPDRGERQLDRLLDILAVIQPEGHIPLPHILATEGARLGRHSTLIVVTSSSDPAWVQTLRGLRARGVHGIAILLAARTFGPAADWSEALGELQIGGLPAYLVRRGDDLSSALARPVSLGGPGSGGPTRPYSVRPGSNGNPGQTNAAI